MINLIKNITGNPYGNIWKLDLKLKIKIRFKRAFFKRFYLKILNLLCKSIIVQSLNHVQLFATPWTVACQVPLSTGFSRQEYSSGQPLPHPADLSRSGTHLSCTSRWGLYQSHQGSHYEKYKHTNTIRPIPLILPNGQFDCHSSTTNFEANLRYHINLSIFTSVHMEIYFMGFSHSLFKRKFLLMNLFFSLLPDGLVQLEVF